MTGSALNIYNGGAPVTRQIELVKAVFAAGVPFFGSCWGLQVAVTAAGGEVRANPRGREFGFGRRILLSDAGREHPLFAGKPAVFEAPTVHRDEIASLPAGAATLAVNDFGVQAASFTCRARHVLGRAVPSGIRLPSTLPRRPSATARRWSRKACSATLAALAAFAAELRALQAAPVGSDAALEARLGSRHAQRGTAAARNPQLAQRPGAASRAPTSRPRTSYAQPVSQSIEIDGGRIRRRKSTRRRVRCGSGI